MITCSRYLRPGSLSEAIEIIARETDARFIAGATDLLVQVRKRRIDAPHTLVSLRSIPELRGIKSAAGLEIGAMTTLAELIEHEAVRSDYPVLVEAASTLGSRQIQNVATIGGNICNASPAADMLPPLLVLDARVRLEGPRGPRELPLADFVTGPGTTCLAADEVLRAIVLSPRPSGSRCRFVRKGRVKMDLAIVNVAALVVVKESVATVVRVAAGAVAPTAMRLPPVEALLAGSRVSDDLLLRAGKLAAACVAPISDLRSSAAYRRELLAVLVRRVLRMLVGP